MTKRNLSIPVKLSLLIACAIGASAQTTAVTLSSPASPASGQPGVTTINVTGSGFPSGTINATNTTVSLKPAAGGASVSTASSAVTTVLGTTRRVTFTIPASINVATATPYVVSVSGTTTTGAAFASSNTAALTIDPAATISSLSPNSGQTGQMLTVTITGSFTNFVQGSTQANFGAGIAVGSGAEGAFGTVTVTSATAATAQLKIDAAAAAGPRNVIVQTGVQQATLTGGFTVTTTPSITLLNPASAPQGATNFPVVVTGQSTHFTKGVTTANFGAGVTVVSLTVASTTSATAVVNVDPAAVAGPRTVTLTTNAESASLTNGFTIIRNAPAITGVSPNAGQQGLSNLPVTITGQLTHFTTGMTTVSFGTGITVVGVMVSNSTSLVATINIPTTVAAALYTVTVTTGNETVSLTNGFTVQPGPPAITLTSPANLSFLNISPTTVNGTVSDPNAKVVVNSITAPVANGSFSAQVPLAEGPNLITATATSSSGLASTATIQVTLDTTPPHVTITSPADQFVTTATSIAVSGSVNDIVVGTVNAQQAQVTVNSVAAQVANRTFLASNIPLNLGANTIQAVARDQAGNAATTQITVTRQVLSGNNQTGPIGTLLPAPLVATLTGAGGNPAANQPVIFKVLQNNGMVGVGSGTPASSVVAMTNSQGQAQVQWTLGLRAGAGSDSVEAYAVGYSGTAIFTATSTPGVPGNIVIDSGNNQIGAIGQQLPKPLIAVVVDPGSNRLPNVPVTFTVQSGGGTLVAPATGSNFTLNQNTPGTTSITVTTDADGRAGATLSLGTQEGNSNNLITANFAGNQGFPATFTASGRAEGPAANTTISGVVLDNSNVPIPGVTVRAVLTNVMNSNSSSVGAAATVQTNAQGQFTISPAPVGFVNLMVDGSTAQEPGTFPSLNYDLVTIAGQNNTLEMPVYLLPLKSANQLCVTAATGGGTLTIPEAPGFSLTFGPGQVTFPGGSQTGCVSVTVVHPDRVPMQPGFGQQPRFIVTIQPSGALFNPPAPITLPNVDGLAPRAVTEMYSFDHDIGSFVAIGTGVVSDDGRVISSSPGVGVLKAGWHCGGNPNPGGSAAYCGPCAFCDGQNCQPNPIQGGSCQNPCVVGGSGTCTGGHCAPSCTPGGNC
jgi:hypothetical protein